MNKEIMKIVNKVLSEEMSDKMSDIKRRIFENKEMYTHTNYILKQICEEKDIEIIENMKERQKTIITKISNEYKKNIVKELDNFIKIMNYYNMNIIQFIDLHIEFYDPVKTVFCC